MDVRRGVQSFLRGVRKRRECIFMKGGKDLVKE